MKVLEAIEVKLNRMSRKNKRRIVVAFYLLGQVLLMFSPSSMILQTNVLRLVASTVWLLLFIMMITTSYMKENFPHIFIIEVQVLVAIVKYFAPLCLAAAYLVSAAKFLELLYYAGAEIACEVFNVVAFGCMISVLISKAFSYARRGKKDKEDVGIKCMWALNIHAYTILISVGLYMQLEWFAQFVSIYFPAITFVFGGWVWIYDVYRKSSDSSREQPQT